MKDTVSIDYDLAKKLVEDIKANPMGDWFDLPDSFPATVLEKIKNAAKRVQENSDYLVCIGIGGSYLGARAVYEALELDDSAKCKLLFAGNSMSSRSLKKVLRTLENYDFSLNVISKSGTTLEPAMAFRVLKEALIKKYGEEEAKRRIIATTDPESGALHDEAVKNNYEMFEVPSGVGGRYSVLTAVGLLPLACAGCDIDMLLKGAKNCKETELADLENSQLIPYAFSRFHLYNHYGCDVEVLASFEPSLLYFNEWWKQLFGESEGKNGQGIFPASVIYSTDLHSLGQFMQDGRRNIFETFLKFSPEKDPLTIPKLDSSDGLEYLESQPFTEISDKAMEATITAHIAGGIPVMTIKAPADDSGISEFSLGYLIFFFEVACALSAFRHNVNPFDQPGVEKYKNEMFRLLGKQKG